VKRIVGASASVSIELLLSSFVLIVERAQQTESFRSFPACHKHPNLVGEQFWKQTDF